MILNKTGKNILVLVGIFDGHIPGIIEIIKDLKSLGHNVTCYVLDKYEKRLKLTGARLITYSVGEIKLPPMAPEIARIAFTFSKCCDIILERGLKSEEKYDYLLYDSFFDGKEINKIFKIPNIIAVYCFPIGEMTEFFKGSIENRSRSLIPINKKYNLNLRDFLFMHYSGDAKYKLMLTSKLFHIQSNRIDDSFFFIGPSIEERPIDNSFTFKKDENKKLIYICLGTVFNNNLEFFKNCIEAFRNSKEFQIILSIGKNLNVKDLGDLPENIFAFNYVPQLQVLKQTDIFITHGGINSINEAILLKNLPLIVIPQEADQFDNAKQIEKYGAGIALGNKTINQEILKESVLKILKDIDKYKNGVETISKSFKESREERKKVFEKLFS